MNKPHTNEGAFSLLAWLDRNKENFQHQTSCNALLTPHIILHKQDEQHYYT